MKKSNIGFALLAFCFIAYGFINKDKLNDYKSFAANAMVTGVAIGNEAPELKFKNPDGKEISLKSLRGNIVLVDFWASWCGPCRRENPNLTRSISTYQTKKFKDAKGLLVYSVSLDKDVAAWQAAILKDNLTWPNHVSDLLGWQSAAAALYGVNSIPTNFLLDAKGIIVAKDLRGAALDAELEKLLAK